MKTLPVLFLGHGSPMNAIEKNSFTDFLAGLSSRLKRPEAILMISAHWETSGVKVQDLEEPKTIHDFGGFPQALFNVRYPAKGHATITRRVADLLHASHDQSWGLDHGTWSVLKHMFPIADIPVVQLSLNKDFSLRDHLDLAKKLLPLRDEGVLIIGSGNITHNLRRVVWQPNAAPLDWAVEFDELIKQALLRRDEKTLLNEQPEWSALWKTAHPTIEHYLPALYVYGASHPEEKLEFLFEDMQLGSLSMRSFVFGL